MSSRTSYLGLGKMLFNSVVGALGDMDYSSMMLWVLRDNPSFEFYKLQGGRVIGQKDITIGGESLVELAVGWDNKMLKNGSKTQIMRCCLSGQMVD
jgi:hypothetical protein